MSDYLTEDAFSFAGIVSCLPMKIFEHQTEKELFKDKFGIIHEACGKRRMKF